MKRHSTKRRTPSAPMVALTPSRYVEIDDESTPPTTMDPRTRDEFILKMLARVERIDTEIELLAAAVKDNNTRVEAVRHDVRQLISEVSVLSKNMDTIKGLLTSVLLKMD